MMKFWRVHKSLSEEQKELLKTRSATIEKTPEELMGFLRPLAYYDRVVDSLRKTCWIVLVVSIILTIIFSVIGFGILAWLCIAAFVASIFGVVWTKKNDLSNNLRQFALPLFSILRDDFDKSQRVRVTIDLRPPLLGDKMLRKTDPYERGVYHKIVDTFYKDPWLSADAVLVDGTKVSWSVVDVIRERSKTKRNARGKYKTKTQYRKRTDLQIEVAMKKKAYDLAMTEMEESDKRRSVALRRVVETRSIDPIEPTPLLDLIASVYRAAKPAA